MPSEFETLLIGGQKAESEASSLHIAEDLGLDPIVIPTMLRELNPKKDYESYLKIKEIIADFKPDIVHTHASKAGALGRLAAINSDVPHLVHTFHGHVFHGYFNPVKTKMYKTVERYLAKKTDQIVTISNIQKTELGVEHRICPLDKIEVIPLGFDLDRFQVNQEENRNTFRIKYQLKEDTVAIGIIGRLVPIKNHELFLKGIQFIKKNSKIKIQAFIIGDGESRNTIEEQAKKLGLSFDNKANTGVDILFTSWIKKVDAALSGLDLVALTSLNEGTPVSLIEAQAAEKAIVTTNVGGIENVVLPNKSALLSEIDDENGFCENLIKLVDDSIMRMEFSKAGKDFVFSNFHYNRLVKDTSELYHKILDKQ
jgi:glycosyltransferase involved in cell wall biosynthesis